MSDREDDDRSGGGTTSPVLPADTAAERRKRLDQERAAGQPPPAPRKPVNRRLEGELDPEGVAHDDEAPKTKKKTAQQAPSPDPVPLKKVKISPLELQDSMHMCASTSRFLKYDNAHIEESRRDIAREMRTNARLAAGFAEGPGTVEFKIANSTEPSTSPTVEFKSLDTTRSEAAPTVDSDRAASSASSSLTMNSSSLARPPTETTAPSASLDSRLTQNGPSISPRNENESSLVPSNMGSSSAVSVDEVSGSSFVQAIIHKLDA